ncbi:MAG: hypothetical protein EU533_00605 [Promethearchaeota archaeon]|nr:MAG: hypothetical protein EU533_00605 [Candidatus Lokiarchaeota archaeon]
MSFDFNPKSGINRYGFKVRNRDNGIFHAIYFLDKLTGSLLLSKEYSNVNDFSLDVDLIGGFLSALDLFIKEVKIGRNPDEIQEINFRETRILYERIGRLLVVAITKKVDLPVERKVLHKIVIDFYNRFEVSINKFNGHIEPSILKYKKRLENTNINNLFSQLYRF